MIGSINGNFHGNQVFFTVPNYNDYNLPTYITNLNLSLKFEGTANCKSPPCPPYCNGEQLATKVNGKLERVNLGEINFEKVEDITKIRLNGLDTYEILPNRVLSFYFTTSNRDELKERAKRELERQFEGCVAISSSREKVEINEIYLEVSVTLINPENNLATAKSKRINL